MLIAKAFWDTWCSVGMRERETERERERPDAPRLAQSREKEREQRSGGGRPRGLRREEGKREGRGPVVVTGTAG